MPTEMVKNNTLSTSWEEDGNIVHYTVTLSSSITGSAFDPLVGAPKIFGQFSIVKKNNASTYEAIRDPLGIGKLFYTETGREELIFSKQFTDLFRYKTKIYSVAGRQTCPHWHRRNQRTHSRHQTW